MNLILLALLGYLVGSVPFAYVIGKVFYHTDVRQHGSGNLGGSNTGRVLGKKAGLTVVALDLLKVTAVVAVGCALCPHPWAAAVGGLAAGIGHCFPVYLGFRGGKAVASLYGLLAGLWFFGGCSPWTIFLPLITFLLVLYLTKFVSLSSMISAVVAGAYLWLSGAPRPAAVSVSLFAVLIILRHRSNIQRLLQGNENKIKWMG